MQEVAARSLALFDQRSCGWEHSQAKRFLDPAWNGLPDGAIEPALRPLMVKLANCEITLFDLLGDGSEAVKLFFYWVSAFKLVRASFDVQADIFSKALSFAHSGKYTAKGLS